MTYRCLLCDKVFKGTLKDKFLANEIRHHNIDDHQANLFFIPDEDVLEMVEEVNVIEPN